MNESKIKSAVAVGSRSVLRSFLTTNLFRRRKMWLWPLAALVLLAFVGVTFRNIMEDSMKETIGANLHTILRADVEALSLWLNAQESNAKTTATDDEIVPIVSRLMKLAADPNVDPSEWLHAPELQELRAELKPFLETHGYHGFAVIRVPELSKTMQIIAADRDELVGRKDFPIPEDVRHRVFDERRPTVSRPLPSVVLLDDEHGVARAGVPTMFAISPMSIAVAEGDPKPGFAAIGLRIRPEEHFTRILSVARSGKTGETYAFDREGVLLSKSIFEDELKKIGMLPDKAGVSSVLNIDLRDPQVDITQGMIPPMRRSEQPLTRMAFDAITMADARSAEDSGPKVHYDVEGYRDYRGVPVVGAWTWLKDYDFGVASEIDVAEAYRPVYILRWAFWTLFGLVSLASLAIFAFTVVVAKLNREAQRSAIRAQKLGQYSLEEKIGAGGMGEVYRGRHAMLQRPTAIKLLHPDKATPAAIARFEREVQLTSQLCHPNTIEVYDFGRTPEGVFYYAMEYLDGMTLDTLVRENGPQPEGRVINILEQVCGSLNEAHASGLIHRDVKPANIVLNKRGGSFDVVKLLDFGLVKSIDSTKDVSLSSPGTLAGTPLYLAPESIESPDETDGRSDIYAVGAVGYFLLTGKPVFEGKNIVEVCNQHLKSEPITPSKRAGREISPDLEAIILRCLAKNPDDRPQTARELGELLAKCRSEGSWTHADAEAWWNSRYVGAGDIDYLTSVSAAANMQTVIVDDQDTE